MLMFAWDFEVDACSRFWRWNLIYVWTWTQPSDLLCLWQFLNMYIGYKSCANQYCSPKLDIYPSNYVQIMFEGRAGGLGGGNSVTKPFMRDIPSIKGWNREYWLLIYNPILKTVLSIRLLKYNILSLKKESTFVLWNWIVVWFFAQWVNSGCTC